jgi:hypothetical protein
VFGEMIFNRVKNLMDKYRRVNECECQNVRAAEVDLETLDAAMEKFLSGSSGDYVEYNRFNWYYPDIGSRFVRKAEVFFNSDFVLFEALPGNYGNSYSKFFCTTPFRCFCEPDVTDTAIGKSLQTTLAFSSVMLKEFLLNSSVGRDQGVEGARREGLEEARAAALTKRGKRTRLKDVLKTLQSVDISQDATTITFYPTTHLKVDEWYTISNKTSEPVILTLPISSSTEVIGETLRQAMALCRSKTFQ